MPIRLPREVEVKLRDNEIVVEGPKGRLSHKIAQGIQVSFNDDLLRVEK